MICRGSALRQFYENNCCACTLVTLVAHAPSFFVPRNNTSCSDDDDDNHDDDDDDDDDDDEDDDDNDNNHHSPALAHLTADATSLTAAAPLPQQSNRRLSSHLVAPPDDPVSQNRSSPETRAFVGS